MGSRPAARAATQSRAAGPWQCGQWHGPADLASPNRQPLDGILQEFYAACPPSTGMALGWARLTWRHGLAAARLHGHGRYRQSPVRAGDSLRGPIPQLRQRRGEAGRAADRLGRDMRGLCRGGRFACPGSPCMTCISALACGRCVAKPGRRARGALLARRGQRGGCPDPGHGLADRNARFSCRGERGVIFGLPPLGGCIRSPAGRRETARPRDGLRAGRRAACPAIPAAASPFDPFAPCPGRQGSAAGRCRRAEDAPSARCRRSGGCRARPPAAAGHAARPPGGAIRISEMSAVLNMRGRFPGSVRNCMSRVQRATHHWRLSRSASLSSRPRGIPKSWGTVAPLAPRKSRNR